MASRKEYAYQVRANQVSLIEKDYTGIDDGLNYTYTSGAGISTPSGSTTYKSPLTDVTSGLEIEYVYMPEFIIGNDEKDIIDLPSYLCKALVNYVKARVAEDALNIEVKEYFMNEFRKMVEKHENAKVGPRRVMPGVGAIR